MQTREFDYFLPANLIAQYPAIPRDSSRLLIYHPSSGSTFHTHFKSLDKYLPSETLLILNHTRVITARFWAKKKTGALIEILALREISPSRFTAFCKPAKRLHEGDELISVRENYSLKVQTVGSECILQIQSPVSMKSLLEEIGVMPLPPYIKRHPYDPDYLYDKKKYQTVFARNSGSIAAPTAGLHFTTDLLKRLKNKGIEIASLTLHVGAGTFLPVKTENIKDHQMHAEWFEIPPETATAVNQAWKVKRPVIAIGTTCVRALESAASTRGKIKPFQGTTQLMIIPGFEFKAITGLITNFHLPRSTLLMLVCAFAGKKHVLELYQEAIKKEYRFYSYGDAMAIF